MKIAPITTKQKLLYTVGLLCAGLAACGAIARQKAPGDVPNDKPQTEQEKETQQQTEKAPKNGDNSETESTKTEIEELPQLLGGDVPYVPESE